MSYFDDFEDTLIYRPVYSRKRRPKRYGKKGKVHWYQGDLNSRATRNDEKIDHRFTVIEAACGYKTTFASSDGNTRWGRHLHSISCKACRAKFKEHHNLKE